MIIRSSRVVLPDAVRPASIRIENGRIVAIDDSARLKGSRSSDEGNEYVRSSNDDVDFGDLLVSPGLVDTHVHVNEPGRTEWEGFDTATRAAAAGGVTTIVDMPLNSVPATTTATALAAKRAAALGRGHVDVAFWGGVVPGNARELDGLVDAGVRGFKCFLVPSGVDEFPAVGEADLREAMPILARRNMPLLVHAELPEQLRSPERLALLREQTLALLREQTLALLREETLALLREETLALLREETLALEPEASAAGSFSEGARAFQASVYRSYLATRPPEAEVAAIQLMVRLAREFGVHVHIVHVACAEAVAEIARAKAEGVRITAETCPHYLTFVAEEIPDGATEFKCAPPIREARDRETLWSGLRSGALDLVATDHSPAPPAMKCRGDFMRAWGGIASLELSLSATWTTLNSQLSSLNSHGSTFGVESSQLSVDPCSMARWLSAAPAALAGLGARKGRIAEGCDADLVVWDPDTEWTVDASRLQQRHKLTPYADRMLRGVVHATYLRGDRVWADGRLARATSGQLL